MFSKMSGLLHATRRLVKQINLFNSRVFVPDRQYGRVKRITFYFEDRQGKKFTIHGDVGDRLRRVICRTITIPNFGICGGMPSCTTCHVVFDPEVYKIVDPPDLLEADLLTRTVTVTPSSRLSCQTFLEEGMDGMTIKLPDELKDIRLLF